ncbi:MAG: recombinase family protein [Chloroflexota bacterium]
MKNAIIYARVSTDEQAEKGYSLPHQINECRRYASFNGFQIAQEITDDYSGATLDRPGFNALLTYIAQNTIDAVIVYTADRLSRNVVDFLVIRDQWERANIELHFVDRGKSQNSFEGLLTDGIFALLAHGERLKIIQRTTDGRHNKAKSNKVVMTGIPPYGYTRVGKAQDAIYQINEEEAEVVKLIFHWYVEGDGEKGPLTLRAIANKLDELGISPPNYRSKIAPYWYPNSVRVILTNPIYTGITYYGKLKTTNGKRSARPMNEWIRIEVPHLAFIDPELYKQARARAERNRELASRNRKNQYLLTGHFRCGRCHKVMVGITRDPGTHPKYLYRCSSSMKKGMKCDNARKQVSMRKIDELVWNWLCSFLTNEDVLEQSITTMIEKRDEELEPKQERLRTLENLLQKADTRIHRLIDELSQYDGETILVAIREKIKEIENEKKMLLEEHGRLSMELEVLELPPDFGDQIRDMIKEAREEINDASFESKRNLMEKLNVNVLYDRDPESGAIKLKASCVIPQFDSAIEYSPSPKSLLLLCNSWTASRARNLSRRWRRMLASTKREENRGGQAAASVVIQILVPSPLAKPTFPAR